MYPGSPSKTVCSAMPLGWQTGTDMTASISLISESSDMRRSWNAELRNFADPAFRLFKIELASGDGEYMTPPLMRLMPGDTFHIVVDADFEDFIPVGGTTKTLIRDPYPGSIRCKNLGTTAIPFTSSGRVVTLDAPAVEEVRISARYDLSVMITEPWKFSERASDRKVNWSVVVEELGGSA
ncbi:hypothetical protein [Neorhizobium galegae]|uniref:Uncharacterized protein n=1 Tax=Neorhizobium galegae bv. orientalis str. HAMBI 540 TaxID=1028800 RepID=A0A068SKU7_NEOGA|nr:hypothetical protein [Neorhizobium galegae]MCQ1855935.1 hypothetical protein [Neorhizobium galegae]CDN46827.1 Hypothetical protein RG540_CH06370 [Neorhizobium galegae bv. orientalis str. HAMBI 540]